MKIYFSCLLFYYLIISVFCTIPKWNLNKAGDDLLISPTYQYEVFYKGLGDFKIKMERIIRKENDIIYYNNSISYNDGPGIIVPFDYIGSHYKINGKFIVCPKGAHHPYNLNTQKYEVPNNFDSTEITDWDLKCIKPRVNGYIAQYLLIVYLAHGKKYFYYRGLYNDESGPIQTEDNEIYGLRVNKEYYHDNQDQQYDTICLVDHEKNLALRGKVFRLSDKGSQDAGSSYKLCPTKQYTRGYYNYDTNSFYYITYDDIYNFMSGYLTTSNDEVNINDLSWAKGFTNNTNSPFEFVDEVEIEKMDFVINNKLVYYKIRNKKNNKIYHGVLDVVENKVVFNTDEEINYFLPYHKESILAITSTNAYKICVYKNENDECVEKCDNGYTLSINGNKCGSSSSCEDDQIILIPDNICTDTCDTNIYVKNGTHCGLCKDFNPNGKQYKLINGTNCIDYDENSMEFYNEHLKLLKCKSGFEQNDDQCIPPSPNCYQTCETCSKYSDDENNQYCLSCKENFNLYGINCKENCPERYKAENRKCEKCTDDYCSSFSINTCDCTECKDHYYKNSTGLCNQCDSICEQCQNEPNNCTKCDDNHFLSNNTCKDCASNCKVKDDDNCKCITCNDGFYVKDYLCEKCIENCNICTDGTKCDKCADNYFVNDQGICTSCDMNCEETEEGSCKCKKCKKGFYEENYLCRNCIENCDVCSNNTKCEHCSANYFINTEGECSKCPTNCKESTDNCLCLSCNDGDFLKEDKTCDKCDTNCKTCDINKDHCTSCNLSHFLNNENHCEECSTECKTCQNDKEHCTSCINGKYLNEENYKCENCSEICGTCTKGAMENNNNCDSCNVDSPYKYLINDTNNKTCVENCTLEGRKFSNDSLRCEAINGTSGDDPTKDNGSTDYLLWIFIIIISIVLIIITILIIKKCCFSSKSDIDDIENIDNSELMGKEKDLVGDDQ